jgi:hypothetical protein
MYKGIVTLLIAEYTSQRQVALSIKMLGVAVQNVPLSSPCPEPFRQNSLAYQGQNQPRPSQ